MGLRDAEPSVNCGASANAEVLNHLVGVRSMSFGSPSRFGRCEPKPANAFAFVWVTATGEPDCSVTIVDTDQSLARAPSTPRGDSARPLPIGRSHTPDATNRCGMSPVE